MAAEKQEQPEFKEDEMETPVFTVQDKEEQSYTKSEEMEIPVFTVLKNNAILKNIFLLDKPPSIPPPSSLESNFKYEKESPKEETLLVGRNPDCNITLEHPSISRFHLRIHSNPSSRSLSVVDLYSVHGTRVSGQKIVPGVMVELKEGDTMQLGGSRRLYKLHWLAITRAYDLDNPFIPPSDTTDAVQETGQGKSPDEDNLEGLQLLFADENLISSVQEMSPLDEVDVEDKKSFEIDHEENMLDVSKIENSVISEVKLEKSSSGSSIWSRRGKPVSVEIQVSQSIQRSAGKTINSAIKSPICEFLQNKSVPQEPCAIDNVVRKQIFTPDDEKNKEIFTPDDSQVKSPVCGYSHTESVSEDPFARDDSVRKLVFTPDKENCSTNSLIKSLEKKGLKNLRSDLALRALFSCVDEDEEEIFTPDKENMTPNTLRQRQMKKMGKSKIVENPRSYISSPLKKVENYDMYKGNSWSDEDEEEIFTPDKENRTPNTLRSRHTKKMGKLTEVEHPKSYRSSPLMTVTDLKAKSDRKPLQHLAVKSTTRTGDSIDSLRPEEFVHSFKNKTNKEEDNRWTMVVDISCLLNKKSRKELQLLRGLKGTSLIIPRIVIRELDCMMSRGNFFRRTTEVSAALEWIEECMENFEGWIHVQSLSEERRPVAPTPPSSPLSWFYEEKGLFSISSSPFSPCTIQDIVTPTTEDHILECALFFKRLRNYGRFVLLSDDVTLKIKAMSEGVICETAREFRDSLVNPFSDRFLYKDSSPRGPTWTCADDVVLKEKYNSGDWKKLSKSGECGAKGLKLILLHNSNFTKISSIR